MKAHFNGVQKKNRNMTNRLMIGGLLVLAVAAMIFLSGCVSQDDAKSATSPKTVTTPSPYGANNPKPLVVPGYPTPTPTSPKIVTPDLSAGANVPPESLIQPPDVPGRIGSFSYFSFKEGAEFIYSTKNFAKSSVTKEAIVSGNRVVGQASSWVSREGQSINVQVKVYDSNVGIGSDFPSRLSSCTDEIKRGTYTSCGSADIGDDSYYHTGPWGGVEITTLVYVKGNYSVFMTVQDKTDASQKEAIRVGRIIESRLK